MQVHIKLKEIRLHAGLTLEQMAPIMYVCREAYRKIEEGITPPDSDKLKFIAKHFGISVQVLTDEDYCIILKEIKNGRLEISFCKSYNPDVHPAALEEIQKLEQALEKLKTILGLP